MKNYPKYTIIMRGYTLEQSEAIIQAMEGLEDKFAVEMTMNTPNCIEYIKKLSKKYGDRRIIGAGTVRTLKDAKEAIEAGAKFLLGPHQFTQDIFDYADKHKVMTVPSAMTPTEINQMLASGADIVKIFPAAVVTPRFFKDVQAPLGKLPLMAVGGVSINNAKQFLNNGATYLGMGSGLFKKEDIENCNIERLSDSLKDFLMTVEGME
nr:bifunctional 4-hydroxy-2-oxoglutarate aldolase/2-dehydro-3-deoxy-phosphogluconate aldolase [Enterococcus cecorum]